MPIEVHEMKSIIIFEDGKSSRGSKAKLIKRGNKRVLIEFTNFNYEKNVEEVIAEWFKVHNPPWNRNSTNKRNNRRRTARYCHSDSNQFYSDWCQTEEYRTEMQEILSKEYYDSLFGNQK